jgi:hypothetical protein
MPTVCQGKPGVKGAVMYAIYIRTTLTYHLSIVSIVECRDTSVADTIPHLQS